MKLKLTLMITALSLLFVSVPAYSQDGAGTNEDYLEDSFRDISLIGATSLGGAILGLSTLSFVEEPGDHLKNIVVGAAVGIIFGVGMVAYMAATKNKSIYEDGTINLRPNKDLKFATTSRMRWHKSKHGSYNQKAKGPTMLGYQFTF